MKAKKFSVRARLRSFGYAFRGLRWLFAEEHNSWIYLIIIILLIPVCLYLKLNTTEWALIFLSIGLVLSAELLNTSIERLADRVTRDQDPLIGRIKDLSAAGVLVAAIAAAAVGVAIMLPKLIELTTF
jgi:diacylglycerol kinase